MPAFINLNVLSGIAMSLIVLVIIMILISIYFVIFLYLFRFVIFLVYRPIELFVHNNISRKIITIMIVVMFLTVISSFNVYFVVGENSSYSYSLISLFTKADWR
jgi:hypothetical protein